MQIHANLCKNHANSCKIMHPRFYEKVESYKKNTVLESSSATESIAKRTSETALIIDTQGNYHKNCDLMKVSDPEQHKCWTSVE